MDLGLRSKKALIAGSSSGLGYAVAAGLLAEGAQVAINGRDPDKLNAAAANLDPNGRNVFPIAGDVTSPDAGRSLVAQAVSAMGGLDLLVTNSGGPKTGKFENMSDQDWLDAFQLNFLSHTRLIRAALPCLRDSSSAAILTITSISAKQPIPDLILSNSIRSGVLGMTKTLSQELGPAGIRVNSILPGFTSTDRVKSLISDRAAKAGTSYEEQYRKQAEAADLKRIATPEEFANVAVFLLSPAASYLTGVMLPVDGGSYKGLI